MIITLTAEERRRSTGWAGQQSVSFFYFLVKSDRSGHVSMVTVLWVTFEPSVILINERQHSHLELSPLLHFPSFLLFSFFVLKNEAWALKRWRPRTAVCHKWACPHGLQRPSFCSFETSSSSAEAVWTTDALKLQQFYFKILVLKYFYHSNTSCMLMLLLAC